MNELHAKFVKSASTELWAHSIKEGAAGKSFGGIQRLFSTDPAKKTNPAYWNEYSRAFYKYSQGKRYPRPIVINQVEDKFPGTKRVIENPLWAILADPRCDEPTLQTYMLQLGPSMSSRLFKYDSNTGALVRKELKNESQIIRISMFNSLEALACLLMLIRESELNRRMGTYFSTIWETLFLLLRLACFYPFAAMAHNILTHIHKHFLYCNDPLPKHLSNCWTKEFPKHFELPPKTDLSKQIDLNKLVLQYALKFNLVSKNKNDQLLFLFWSQSRHWQSGKINRLSLIKELRTLSNATIDKTNQESLPPNIQRLMQMIQGDSRKHIPNSELFG